VSANLRGAAAPTSFVTSINYNAKGQRTLIEYGNGVKTEYKYDPDTFRLAHLLTTREPADFPGDCPNPPPAGWPGCQTQNLHYTYDPAGNITHIRDDAQQTIYFRNRRVEPSAEYTYDPIYRLIEATGREHLGQTGAPIPAEAFTGFLSPIDHPGDGNAMDTYLESYLYDAVGNVLEMQHQGAWTRQYAYHEASLLEPGKQGNRLTSTTLGGNTPIERYVYDLHGNMTRLPHLGGTHPDPNVHWDFRDQIRQADLPGGGTAYYTYDSAGQRVRKVVVKNGGALVESRTYLGVYETYQRNGVNALVRETLHIMDDKQRVALVETRTDAAMPEQLVRYQFGNHLGSASLELDDHGQMISYEEYFPYGGTSYHAVRSQTDAPKRYRYTGKERDEETGLYYHEARYYACWLGRWVSCDPVFLYTRSDPYTYVSCGPVSRSDVGGRYDPSALGESMEAKISQAESAALIEDSSVWTSLANTAIATTATLGRGTLSILQVGTGAAQGVEDIERGFSETGDAWDVAIGASRILSDTGEVASASLGVAGTGSKVARTGQVALAKREIAVLQAERRVAAGQEAAKLSEQLGELNAQREFLGAGYESAGNLKRIPSNGGKVTQGVDQGYRNVKPFQGREAVVEAKGLSNTPSAENQSRVLKTDTRGLVEGSEEWNLDRLESASRSGNKNAQQMLERLQGNAPDSYLSVTSTQSGETTVYQLRGAAGRPVAAPLEELQSVSPVPEMVGAAVLDNLCRDETR
jgi:RHS repeat-associated protein